MLHREAQDTRADRKLFCTLWREFLEEMNDDPPSDYNIQAAKDLMMFYTRNEVQGIVVFAMEGDTVVGVGMAGLQPPGIWQGFDDGYGLTGTLWGIYIRPEYRRKGMSHALLDWGQTHPKMKGIKGYWASVRNTSEAAMQNALRYSDGKSKALQIFGHSSEGMEE